MRDIAMRGWSHVGKCRSISRVQGEDTDHTDHTTFRVCRSEWGQKLVGLPGKALTQGVMRRLWFDVYAAGWRHSVVLYERAVALLSSRPSQTTHTSLSVKQ